MKLKDYLTQNKMTATELAGRIGCSHTTILRLASDECSPSMSMQRRLYAATNGAVCPNDFLVSVIKNGSVVV